MVGKVGRIGKESIRFEPRGRKVIYIILGGEVEMVKHGTKT